MEVPQTLETLKGRASLLRESMRTSQIVTDSMFSIYGSFDHRLSALETAIRPHQGRVDGLRRAHDNIQKTLELADVILAKFDLSQQAEAKLLKGPDEDLESYIKAIDQLRSNVCSFSSNARFKGSDAVLDHHNKLVASAILKLEEHLKQLLSSCSKPVEPDRLYDCLRNSLPRSSESTNPQGDSSGRSSSTTNRSEHQVKSIEATIYTPPTLIPPRILPMLHDLAQQMVQAQRQQHFLKIYREARAPALEQSLRKLGVEKLSKDDVQKMQWEDLETKIGSWIPFMQIAFKLLFAGEREVCDLIFEGIDSLKDQSFAEVTANSVSMLLSFGDAIAKSKRSPEKLFVLLDMYEIMHELQPEIEKTFNGKACSDIRESALSLTKHLAQTVQETFGDFEEAVEKDTTKTVILDETVHPLTSYVINYVKFLLDYQSTLKQLFEEFGSGGETNSQLGSMTMRIMHALQTNLHEKSKQIKDPALAYLFLMNNINYVVRSVCRSEANNLLGSDWVEIHRRIVLKNATQYRRVILAKILQTLAVQGLTSSVRSNGANSSGVSRSAVKERFKSFNMQFEELHERQSQWTVPDPDLREHLRLLVNELLLPAYSSFIRHYGSLVENGKGPKDENGKNRRKYMKYTSDDVERILYDSFEGNTCNTPKQ